MPPEKKAKKKAKPSPWLVRGRNYHLNDDGSILVLVQKKVEEKELVLAEFLRALNSYGPVPQSVEVARCRKADVKAGGVQELAKELGDYFFLREQVNAFSPVVTVCSGSAAAEPVPAGRARAVVTVATAASGDEIASVQVEVGDGCGAFVLLDNAPYGGAFLLGRNGPNTTKGTARDWIEAIRGVGLTSPLVTLDVVGSAVAPAVVAEPFEESKHHVVSGDGKYGEETTLLEFKLTVKPDSTARVFDFEVKHHMLVTPGDFSVCAAGLVLPLLNASAVERQPAELVFGVDDKPVLNIGVELSHEPAAWLPIAAKELNRKLAETVFPALPEKSVVVSLREVRPAFAVAGAKPGTSVWVDGRNMLKAWRDTSEDNGDCGRNGGKWWVIDTSAQPMPCRSDDRDDACKAFKHFVRREPLQDPDSEKHRRRFLVRVTVSTHKNYATPVFVCSKAVLGLSPLDLWLRDDAGAASTAHAALVAPTTEFVVVSKVPACVVLPRRPVAVVGRADHDGKALLPYEEAALKQMRVSDHVVVVVRVGQDDFSASEIGCLLSGISKTVSSQVRVLLAVEPGEPGMARECAAAVVASDLEYAGVVSLAWLRSQAPAAAAAPAAVVSGPPPANLAVPLGTAYNAEAAQEWLALGRRQCGVERWQVLLSVVPPAVAALSTHKPLLLAAEEAMAARRGHPGVTVLAIVKRAAAWGHSAMAWRVAWEISGGAGVYVYANLKEAVDGVKALVKRPEPYVVLVDAADDDTVAGAAAKLRETSPECAAGIVAIVVDRDASGESAFRPDPFLLRKDDVEAVQAVFLRAFGGNEKKTAALDEVARKMLAQAGSLGPQPWQQHMFAFSLAAATGHATPPMDFMRQLVRKSGPETRNMLLAASTVRLFCGPGNFGGYNPTDVREEWDGSARLPAFLQFVYTEGTNGGLFVSDPTAAALVLMVHWELAAPGLQWSVLVKGVRLAMREWRSGKRQRAKMQHHFLFPPSGAKYSRLVSHLVWRSDGAWRAEEKDELSSRLDGLKVAADVESDPVKAAHFNIVRAKVFRSSSLFGDALDSAQRALDVFGRCEQKSEVVARTLIAHIYITRAKSDKRKAGDAVRAAKELVTIHKAKLKSDANLVKETRGLLDKFFSDDHDNGFEDRNTKQVSSTKVVHEFYDAFGSSSKGASSGSGGDSKENDPEEDWSGGDSSKSNKGSDSGSVGGGTGGGSASSSSSVRAAKLGPFFHEDALEDRAAERERVGKLFRALIL